LACPFVSSWRPAVFRVLMIVDHSQVRCAAAATATVHNRFAGILSEYAKASVEVQTFAPHTARFGTVDFAVAAPALLWRGWPSPRRERS
jgi:hypothetical protein